MKTTKQNFKKSQSLSHFFVVSLATTVMISPFSLAYALDVASLPVGEKVLVGEASFDRSIPNVLNIKQDTDRLFIDWNGGFNIGEKASTHFYQPDRSSIVVNRVTGKSTNPTKILGELTSNGRVIILDKNGVIFGKSSRVDVGALVASTGDIDAKQFMNEKRIFIKNATQGAIINKGQITVEDAGLAALVAPNVRNDGLIVARKGNVVMGQAQLITLDLYGDGLIELKVGELEKKSKILNNGKIDNEGGKILVTVAYVDKAVKELVNMKDISQGETFKIKNGKIIISKKNTEPVGNIKIDPNNDVVTVKPTPTLTPPEELTEIPDVFLPELNTTDISTVADPVPFPQVANPSIPRESVLSLPKNYSFTTKAQYKNWDTLTSSQEKLEDETLHLLSYDLNQFNKEVAFIKTRAIDFLNAAH